MRRAMGLILLSLPIIVILDAIFIRLGLANFMILIGVTGVLSFSIIIGIYLLSK